jgi:cytochrome b561
MKYPIFLRLLHWLIALSVIGLLAVGWVMEGLPSEDVRRGTLYALHKSFGVSVFVLMLLRVVIRLTSTVPALPAHWSPVVHRASSAAYLCMYLLLLAIPIAGYLMTNGFGFTVYWFGIALPPVIEADKALGALARTTHKWLAYSLLAVILLHVGAVIQHLIVDRENLLKRMW